jgi:DNA-binding NtrC family response regulator
MPRDELAGLFEVLVVDDEPAARELIVEYFNSLGFHVTGAQDGRSAIATLQRSNGRFGLVVTDLNLPGADGFAVLQAARQANQTCYVVIVTGYASLDSAIRAVRVGAYDYLTKPFSLGQLDVILARIRDLTMLEQQNQRLRRHLPERQVPAGPAAAAPAPAAIEQRVAAIESAIGRIESLLQPRG